MTTSKVNRLRNHMHAGEYVQALAMAAKFPRLGKERDVIQKGWAAHNNPAFYRELGHDPQKLINAALRAIKIKYKIEY